MSDFAHDPVMAGEILGVFSDIEPGVFLDATLGGAGHAVEVLAAHADVTLLGIDQDDAALDAAARRLEQVGLRGRATLRRARFDSLAKVVGREGADGLVGALFDLGVSSPQLDVTERGFSHRHDAPLDMRMDRTREISADTVVNSYDEADLARIIRENSDERFAGRIARAIVANRPVQGTADLARIVTDAIPAATRRRGGHPARRTFQALRIEVNQELEILPEALRAAIGLLRPGARLAVLSYHSGEDRIVKSVLRDAESGGCTCPTGLPCACGAVGLVRRVRTRREPTAEEIARNPRARSARLRVVEKTGGGR
ncbi:MAG: 16S rRNA (cytosine(1402)-N(4))-methyltransferase RsmH [Acidimicrobiales bacterium]